LKSESQLCRLPVLSAARTSLPGRRLVTLRVARGQGPGRLAYRDSEAGPGPRKLELIQVSVDSDYHAGPRHLSRQPAHTCGPQAVTIMMLSANLNHVSDSDGGPGPAARLRTRNLNLLQVEGPGPGPPDVESDAAAGPGSAGPERVDSDGCGVRLDGHTIICLYMRTYVLCTYIHTYIERGGTYILSERGGERRRGKEGSARGRERRPERDIDRESARDRDWEKERLFLSPSLLPIYHSVQ
jgi:hypothetical protein